MIGNVPKPFKIDYYIHLIIHFDCCCDVLIICEDNVYATTIVIIDNNLKMRKAVEHFPQS